LLHFLLTLNFCLRFGHDVQGSPLGELQTVFNWRPSVH
jgi:hypothetical protein